MRIISGKARGLRLASLPAKSLSIRPTSDRAREALFSILGERIIGARVVDLYAGTGAFGLEALSRGAQSALFIDSSPVALELIRKNLHSLQRSMGDEMPPVTVRQGDLRKGLSAILGRGAHPQVFDIVFLDPPYDQDLALRTLHHLDEGSFMAEGGLIVAEERAKGVLSGEFRTLRLIDSRKYGDTGFWIYTSR